MHVPHRKERDWMSADGGVTSYFTIAFLPVGCDQG